MSFCLLLVFASAAPWNSNEEDHHAGKRAYEANSGLREDNLIAKGWLQCIKDHTRTMKDQRPSCIDHLYVTHYTYIDYIENQNISGTDHNLIGANLKFGSPVFVPQTFKHRKGTYFL